MTKLKNKNKPKKKKNQRNKVPHLFCFCDSECLLLTAQPSEYHVFWSTEISKLNIKILLTNNIYSAVGSYNL
jgi:hypothetical protein